MHYPHERNERSEILTTLVNDAQQNFRPLTLRLLIIGLLIITLTLGSSTLLHKSVNTPSWIWILYWNLGFIFLIFLLFFLPLVPPRIRPFKLFNKSRIFIIRALSPTLLTFQILGNLIAYSMPNKLEICAITWACGSAISLITVSNFNLPAVRNLGFIQLALILSIGIAIIRQESITLVSHQVANIILILAVGLPLTITGLYFNIFKR